MPPTSANNSPCSYGESPRRWSLSPSSIYICRRLSETNILGKCLPPGLVLPGFVIGDSRGLSSDGGIGQAIGLEIVFTRNVRYGELERMRQFSARPMQRIKSRAATGV